MTKNQLLEKLLKMIDDYISDLTPEEVGEMIRLRARIEIQKKELHKKKKPI